MNVTQFCLLKPFVMSQKLTPREIRHARISLRKMCNEVGQQEVDFHQYFAQYRSLDQTQMKQLFQTLKKLYDELYLRIPRLLILRNTLCQHDALTVYNLSHSIDKRTPFSYNGKIVDDTDRLITLITLWHEEICMAFMKTFC